VTQQRHAAVTKTQELIYQLVKRRPRTTAQLMDLIYWMHPQDAPHKDVIKAQVWHLNQVLKQTNQRVCGVRSANQYVQADTVYHLEYLDAGAKQRTSSV
jgi:hypothetical protein